MYKKINFFHLFYTCSHVEKMTAVTFSANHRRTQITAGKYCNCGNRFHSPLHIPETKPFSH